MFDTHVNLHGDVFADDLNEVLERARDAGVSKFLAICDRLDSLPAIHSIVDANSDMWCSAGIHPHHSKDFTDFEPEQLKAYADLDKTVAIGETGLDFHYGYSDEDVQVTSFRKHISVARDAGLPLIIHSRNADDLMGEILQDEMAKGHFQPLLHCYTGGQKLADLALELGAYFSVSGILSFKNAHDVRSVIRSIPLEKIVLETDCPYLAPVPMRGRRNEPAFLQYVCAALASLVERPVEEVAELTFKSAEALFPKAKTPA